MHYSRDITNLVQQWLFRKKVIIIYGPRQVGKTTLSKYLIKQHGGLYINCELPKYREILLSQDIEAFNKLAQRQNLIILDEAQTIENIGLFLKIVTDTYQDIQIIATGSSSFDLANKISEPLTGRSIRFMLYPLSISELKHHYLEADINAKLNDILIYGLYPEIFNNNSQEAITKLNEIADNYLYKDILAHEEVKKPRLIQDLLTLLALQIGNEVSLTELSNTLKTNVHTISRYLELLEQGFVIFRLRAFSRNLRKEVAKSCKFYFYDLGIRNFIINNFNPLNLRNDIGALWENFCVMERVKMHSNVLKRVNVYFWRTYDKQEIDYIEEHGGNLYAFEFKYNAKSKAKPPKIFTETYNNSSFNLIHCKNYLEYISSGTL